MEPRSPQNCGSAALNTGPEVVLGKYLLQQGEGEKPLCSEPSAAHVHCLPFLPHSRLRTHHPFLPLAGRAGLRPARAAPALVPSKHPLAARSPCWDLRFVCFILQIEAAHVWPRMPACVGAALEKEGMLDFLETAPCCPKGTGGCSILVSETPHHSLPAVAQSCG